MLIPVEHTTQHAWDTHTDRVKQLIASVPSADVIEIGAGRGPTFTRDSVPDSVSSYTINDIDQGELDLAPQGFLTECFDVCGDDIPDARYDVAFSKMLAEHVPDGPKFHSNILKLLKPGGVAFHFFPTLYSPPFVINKLLPNRLAWALLNTFSSKRTQKFPAYYSMCHGASEKLTKQLQDIGYAEVRLETFYGHTYFRSIPIVRTIDDALTRFAYRRGIRLLGSYAFLTVKKHADTPCLGAGEEKLSTSSKSISY